MFSSSGRSAACALGLAHSRHDPAREDHSCGVKMQERSVEWSVSLLANDDLGLATRFSHTPGPVGELIWVAAVWLLFFQVVIFPVNEPHRVGVLLDRPAFT